MIADLSPVPTVPLGGGRPHERADWTAERSQAINFNVSLLFFRIMYQLEMEVARNVTRAHTRIPIHAMIHVHSDPSRQCKPQLTETVHVGIPKL